MKMIRRGLTDIFRPSQLNHYLPGAFLVPLQLRFQMRQTLQHHVGRKALENLRTLRPGK